MGFGDWFSDSIASPIYHGFGEAKDVVHDSWKDLTGATAAEEAAKVQATAADKDLAFKQKMYDEQMKLNEPWRQIGVSSLSDLSSGIKSGAFESNLEEFKDSNGANPQFQDPGQLKEFNFKADPGYLFRQQQAQQAIERSAAANGGLFSGATLSDIGGKISQMASEEYGNAYNRYESDRNNQQVNRNFAYNAYNDRVNQNIQNKNFNYGVFSDNQNRKRQQMGDRFSRLSTLAGFGDAGANRTQQVGTNFGDTASASILNKANAQASGIVGAANANSQGMMGLASLAAKIYGAS